MLQTKDVEIGGHLYRLKQWDFVSGRGLFVRLIKCLAPAIKELKDKDGWAAALAGIVEGLPEALFCELLDATCRSAVLLADGKELPLGPVASLHFAGRYVDATRLLIEAIQLNGFLDFLPVLESLFGPPDTPEPSKSV